MVAYSTSPNAVALDGTGTLSPFTGAFDKIIGTSGYSVQRVMKRAVGEETDWKQTPWMKSSLTGELKLGGGETLAEAPSHLRQPRGAVGEPTRYRRQEAAGHHRGAQGTSRGARRAGARAPQSLYGALPGRPESRNRAAAHAGHDGSRRLHARPRDRLQAQCRLSWWGLNLWSVSKQKVVAKPDVGRGDRARADHLLRGRIEPVSLDARGLARPGSIPHIESWPRVGPSGA